MKSLPCRGRGIGGDGENALPGFSSVRTPPSDAPNEIGQRNVTIAMMIVMGLWMRTCLTAVEDAASCQTNLWMDNDCDGLTDEIQRGSTHYVSC